MEGIGKFLGWLTQSSNQIFLWVGGGIIAVILVFWLLGHLVDLIPLSRNKAFPTDTREANLLALGQAVAVAVWGVGLGLITREESARLIEQVNELARAEFDSWASFGRSFALGRVMHWSDGVASERRATWGKDAAFSLCTALDPKQRGPWGLLPWKV